MGSLDDRLQEFIVKYSKPQPDKRWITEDNLHDFIVWWLDLEARYDRFIWAQKRKKSQIASAGDVEKLGQCDFHLLVDLNSREGRILQCRIDGYSWKETAKKMRLKISQCRYIYSKAMAKIREAL